MKVAVVNTYDAKNVKMWSGTSAHICKMLEVLFQGNITYIDIPVKRSVLSYFLGFYYNKIVNKRYLSWTDKSLITQSDKIYKPALNKHFDLILTFEFFLVPIIKNNSKAKIILWNDATFNNLVNFYSYVSNICDYSLNQGHSFQKLAFDSSDSIIYSSDWAINSALNFYSVDPKKLHKITFASNLSEYAFESDLVNIIKFRSENAVSFLFLAVDWERKGGEDAVKLINLLNESGIKCSLLVVGVDIPEIHQNNKNIISHGYINKNTTEGEKRLIAFLKTSTFLLIPTRADCTPVAFSEANSFALPAITTNVGGIPSVISNNVNGGAFEVATFVEESVKFINNYLPGSDSYTKLCYSSYNYYRKNMSWDQVERKFKHILAELNVLPN